LTATEHRSDRIERVLASSGVGPKQRVFRIIVEDDEEEAKLLAKLERDHGLTDDDLVILRRMIGRAPSPL
jgi:hypothetical protein